jgi:chromosomal replication initiation ATPase DnaA
MEHAATSIADEPDASFPLARPSRPSQRPPRTAASIIEALEERDLVGMLDTICRARGVTRDELCGRERTKNIALARHELWWTLRNTPAMSFSYVEIGRIFGRDHSSVLHGVRAFERAKRR